MKKILSFGLLLIILTASCKDDPVQDGTLKVVNQTSCSYNIIGGIENSQENEYVGTVGPNETKEFIISIPPITTVFNHYKAIPINCASGQIHNYSITFTAGDTKQILIN